jgi:hypothetical protein
MAFALIVVACGSDGGQPASNDQGMKGGCACVGGAPSTTQSVDWNAPTSIGKTAAEAFGGLSGTCTAPLSWDGTSSDELVIKPVTGSSTVTVDVTVDEMSAKVVTAGSGGGLRPPPELTVDASVHIASEDGTFVVDATSTASYFGNYPEQLQFTVTADKLGGKLSIVPKDPKTTVQLAFEVGPIANGCTGDVRIETATAVGANGAMGSSGPFASWSDMGAP